MQYMNSLYAGYVLYVCMYVCMYTVVRLGCSRLYNVVEGPDKHSRCNLRYDIVTLRFLIAIE